jgi:hypothetical protein
MDHDIASSQADRKASRKLSPNQQAQKKSIFPNEKTPQLSPPRPNSD